VRGGQVDERALPVGLVDLPEPLAGPPAADRGHHVVDPAEAEPHLRGDPLGAGEAAVVVHHQVQPVGGGGPEHLPELVGPGLRAGRHDHIGAGGEIAADDALPDRAGAARDQNPSSMHELSPSHQLVSPTLVKPT